MCPLHAILEGVSKRLLSAYLDSSYHFYLDKVTKQIDGRMQRIKPPHELRRSPWLVYSLHETVETL